MITIIFIIISILLVVYSIWLFKNDHLGTAMIAFLVGLGFFCFFILNNIFTYDNLIKQESQYRVIDDKLKIQDTRRENTIMQLKSEMLNYVQYEKGVFDSLKADNVSLILFKFPELKTIESVKMLMQQITKLNDGYYGMLFAKKDLEAYFSSINRNKLVIFGSDFNF
jgi:cell division protein FtsB